MVVDSLLGLLGFHQVLLYHQHYATDPFPHGPHMLHNCSVKGGLLFPGLFVEVKQTPGSSPKNQLVACGVLGFFPYGEQYVGDHEVPVSSIFHHHPL